MKPRWDKLSNIIKAFEVKTMIEIGVGKADNAIQILLKEPKDFKYIGIDPYEHYADYNNDVNSTYLRLAANWSTAFERLKPYIDKGVVELISMRSHLAVDKFEDQSVDLIFIDGNHSYKAVKQDLELYWPKLKNGGVMTGHDYGDPNFPGVVQAVNEFTHEYGFSMHYMEVDEDVFIIHKKKSILLTQQRLS